MTFSGLLGLSYYPRSREGSNVDQKLTRIVVLAVTIVWIVSFLADIVLERYEPSPYIHIAMMAVVGAATARYIYIRNGGPHDPPR